jgi:CubicO group peptidase (beta-lactamase class C family)
MHQSAHLSWIADRRVGRDLLAKVARSGGVAVALGLALVLAVQPLAADEYPLCDRSMTLPWPPSCIVGSYRHYGDIFESRPVHKQGEPSALSNGEPVTDVSYDVRNSTYKLDDYFSRSHTAGIIVLKNGRIVFERYLLGADEHSLFNSQSIGKSFTSTLVGFAIGDGLIRSVDDPISDYVPELKGSGYEGVPIKAVLQMSSGVDWDDDSDLLRMSNESMRLNTTPTIEFARNVKRSGNPFDKFNYAGVNAVALGWMVSRVSGKTLSDYLSEKLWRPLGMESDASWVTDGKGPTANEIANGGLNVTLRDYARFGLFMSHNGVWQGKQLLPPSWVAEATRPDRPQVAFGKLYSGYKLGYQYQWWAFPGPDHAFEGKGTRGQFLYVNPAEDLVIVVTSAWPTYWDDTLEEHTYAVFAAFSAALRH